MDIGGSTISYNNVGATISGVADAEVSGTVEYNASGLAVLGSSTAEIIATLSDNTTLGALVGSTGSVTFALCTVEDNGVGVYTSGSGVNPFVNGCTVESNTIGLRYDYSAAGLVRSSSIKSNGTGVIGGNSALPDLGDVGAGQYGHNVFNKNTWDVSNLTVSTTIMAEGNCWNAASGPKIIGTGSVDTDPHDTSCPSGTAVSGRDGEDPKEPALPTRYALADAHPNPFNPTITVRYDVPAPGGPVQIQVYDVSGRLVTTLTDGERPAGRHAVTWNGQSTRGGPVASGVYFVKMTATGFGETRKIVLLK